MKTINYKQMEHYTGPEEQSGLGLWSAKTNWWVYLTADCTPHQLKHMLKLQELNILTQTSLLCKRSTKRANLLNVYIDMARSTIDTLNTY